MPGKKNYIQELFAEHLGGNSFGKDTKIYKFEKIKRAKRAAMEANPTKELFERLNYELKIIEETKYADYFLVCLELCILSQSLKLLVIFRQDSVMEILFLGPISFQQLYDMIIF